MHYKDVSLVSEVKEIINLILLIPSSPPQLSRSSVLLKGTSTRKLYGNRTLWTQSASFLLLI